MPDKLSNARRTPPKTIFALAVITYLDRLCISAAMPSIAGEFILTSSAGRTARVYPPMMFILFGEMMKLARRLSLRELTPEEREWYLHVQPAKRALQQR